MINKNKETKKLLHAILQGIEDTKGLDVCILNLKKLEHAVCEYFVICTGTSSIHLDALMNSVKRKVRENTKEKPWHVEGLQGSNWILLDYVNIVVHVFLEETRTYYGLESFWGDAEELLPEELSYKNEIS